VVEVSKILQKIVSEIGALKKMQLYDKKEGEAYNRGLEFGKQVACNRILREIKMWKKELKEKEGVSNAFHSAARERTRRLVEKHKGDERKALEEWLK